MPKLNRSALKITAEHDTPIPVRDGTVLRADVYRPAGDGPFPTMLVRTPYGEQTFRGLPVVPAMEAGFAVVLQHCRGRGSSDGEFRPWLDEGPDGYDTIAWIAGRPWSNGEVVGWGGSYLAGCALQAAAQRPPALKAVVASVTPHDFYDGLKYHGGAFALGSALNWGTMQTLLGLMHATEAGEDTGAAFGQVFQLLGGGAENTLPVTGISGIPWWQDWAGHPTRDAYWEGLGETLRHDRIEVPVMHIGGWFDLFLTGTLENHRRLGGPLVIGPWTHGQMGAAAGRLYFGFGAAGAAVQLEQRQLAFLKGEDTGPAVHLFVMGANVWRAEESWPLARAVDTPYHLHAGGLLSPEPPAADAAPSTFDFDPADPVPSTGGPLLIADTTNVGPQDQREVEARADVLSFTTPVLEQDVEVTGPLSVTLHAASSSASTDWTAKLVDVWPDGRAMSVIDGILRTSGELGTRVIDLVATSQLFRAGHRIRVEISSSNFPRFDRNTGPDLAVHHQTVFHDAARPSWITLPIVPSETA